jgi:Peptidase family C25
MNLIITNRTRLLAKYGETGLASIVASAKQLYQAWLADDHTQYPYFTYVDDAASLAPLGLKPIIVSGPTPAQDEAYAIRDLLTAIEARGQHIDHLLILGGPNIVPFFALDNPVLDVDEVVLSDNPYGVRGSDNLIPDRCVGRMPDAEPADATPLLRALQTAIKARAAQLPPATQQPALEVAALTSTRPGCLRPFAAGRTDKGLPTGRAMPPTPPRTPKRGGDVYENPSSVLLPAVHNERGFGYAAEIWQNSSRLIYQTVTRMAGGEDLCICPPTTAVGFQPQWLQNRFLYFNLHGIVDSSPWFGQSQPLVATTPFTFPVALRPDQLQANEHIISLFAPFVFSEACFGAYISGKATNAAICLSFLASGASVFVGSTVTSYGRPDPPLYEADLLTVLFFEHLYNGLTAGRALVEARRDYARTMLQQHGALDDDDDKTLLEFVLYGDPTLRAF